MGAGSIGAINELCTYKQDIIAPRAGLKTRNTTLQAVGKKRLSTFTVDQLDRSHNKTHPLDKDSCLFNTAFTQPISWIEEISPDL